MPLECCSFKKIIFNFVVLFDSSSRHIESVFEVSNGKSDSFQ